MAKPSRGGHETQQEQLIVQNEEREGRGEVSRGSPILTKSIFVVVITIFSTYTTVLIYMYFTMPTLNRNLLKFPRTVAELRSLMNYISLYTVNYKPQVLLGFCTTYIFMQTFMIPGTVVLSLLAGSLFGASQGMMLVISTATIGASCSFLLSKLIGCPFALWMWPDKLRDFTAEVGYAICMLYFTKRRAYLFNYILFLRITPTLPNTFINVCAPSVDIPFFTFLIATVIGLMPATFVTVPITHPRTREDPHNLINTVHTPNVSLTQSSHELAMQLGKEYLKVDLNEKV